jgi:hypothetical protein
MKPSNETIKEFQRVYFEEFGGGDLKARSLREVFEIG